MWKNYNKLHMYVTRHVARIAQINQIKWIIFILFYLESEWGNDIITYILLYYTVLLVWFIYIFSIDLIWEDFKIMHCVDTY